MPEQSAVNQASANLAKALIHYAAYASGYWDSASAPAEIRAKRTDDMRNMLETALEEYARAIQEP